MLRVVAARALIPRGSLRVATLCSPASSPYAVLGVRPTATDDEVKARFLKLVKENSSIGDDFGLLNIILLELHEKNDD